MDTAVKGIFEYDQGSSRGFHLSGCWIGIDPATGAEHLSGAALAAFRHRDKGTGGTRPELPNMENWAIGVKPKSTNPRAQFNVLAAIDGGLTIAAEGMRCTVAGNQFLGPADSEIGRYNDTQVPSIVFGTDGDGVNYAEEGNLFPATSALFYGTSDKVYVFAGNIFGLARDGSRPNATKYAVDEFNLSARTNVRFGSNFDGVNDALEANTLYDSLGFTGNRVAPDNNAWILMRGNVLVNNDPLPMDELTGASTYDKFIDTAGGNPITPVITAATTASLTGTCGLPLAGVAQVVVDVYVADQPDPHMRRHLSRRLGTARCPVEVLPVPLEALTLTPESFDAVVATLVFCSVPDQAAALGYVRALLRPGGQLVFLEHVAAEQDAKAAKWQRLLDPVCCRVAGGCHLTRRTEEAIREAGFVIERIDRAPMRKAPKLVRATIPGVARRPDAPVD